MAVKTKAQILSDTASVLADNTSGDITPSDVRSVLTDVVDSYKDEFKNLLDTPSSYSGKEDYLVKVNSAGDGLEFLTPDEFVDWADVTLQSGFTHGSERFQMKLQGGFLHFKGVVLNSTGSTISSRTKVGTAPASLASKIVNKFLPVMIYDSSGNNAYFHGAWIYSNRDVYISKGGLGWKANQGFYVSTSIINDAKAF